MAGVTDYMSRAEILAALAEESAELAQAALKLRRAATGASPTPVTVEDAWWQMVEEIADVACCLDEISGLDWGYIDRLAEAKRQRWISRLTGVGL